MPVAQLAAPAPCSTITAQDRERMAAILAAEFPHLDADHMAALRESLLGCVEFRRGLDADADDELLAGREALLTDIDAQAAREHERFEMALRAGDSQEMDAIHAHLDDIEGAGRALHAAITRQRINRIRHGRGTAYRMEVTTR